MFAGYNNDYRESKDNYNRKSMLPLLKCQITTLGVITHRLRTTAIDSYLNYLSHPQNQVTQEFWLPQPPSLDQLDSMLPT